MSGTYPYHQVARFAAPNLLIGNTILMKHASSCPESSAMMQAIFMEAGFPAGDYINIYASFDQVARSSPTRGFAMCRSLDPRGRDGRSHKRPVAIETANDTHMHWVPMCSPWIESRAYGWRNGSTRGWCRSTRWGRILPNCRLAG